jgi:hypothetical protein
MRGSENSEEKPPECAYYKSFYELLGKKRDKKTTDAYSASYAQRRAINAPRLFHPNCVLGSLLSDA